MKELERTFEVLCIDGEKRTCRKGLMAESEIMRIQNEGGLRHVRQPINFVDPTKPTDFREQIEMTDVYVKLPMTGLIYEN